MKPSKLITLYVLSICANFQIFAQKQNLDSLITTNYKTLTYSNGSFAGEGWDLIIEQTKKSQHVLIGEDHFFNEIPSFIKAVFNANDFENFYIEVDPYSTEIIQKSILTLKDADKERFNSTYKDLFSFYALQPEYDLLEHIVNSGTKLLGSDQILMYADRLIAQHLSKSTKNSEAKKIYEHIMEQSRVHLDTFLINPKKPMYMLTPDFSEQVEKLSTLNLSEKEQGFTADIKRSKTIYLERSHKKRVRLLMNGVMNDLPKWNSKKTLFKYGANHLTRGEGFLNVYDIGNLVANITESNYQDTFHIMILGESGMQGSLFRSLPPSQVDSENDFYLSYLKPFFNITEGNDWHVFDLLPFRKALLKNQLKIVNKNLERVIRGYDALVIIPKVTAAKF